VLLGGKRERRGRAIESAQAHVARKLAGQRRVLGGDQDPLLAAAVSAELDVVAECPLVPRRRSASRELDEGMGRVIGQAQGRRSGEHRSHELRGALVERNQRAADRRQAVRLRVLEQRGDDIRSVVGGKAQPPRLVGPRDVDHALVVAPLRAAALQRPGKRIRDVHAARHGREQEHQRACPVGVQRNPPDSLLGIPPPPRDRAQQLAQALVIGKPQHGLAIGE
jgi:hypothetical protein